MIEPCSMHRHSTGVVSLVVLDYSCCWTICDLRLLLIHGSLSIHNQACKSLLNLSLLLACRGLDPASGYRGRHANQLRKVPAAARSQSRQACRRLWRHEDGHNRGELSLIHGRSQNGCQMRGSLDLNSLQPDYCINDRSL